MSKATKLITGAAVILLIITGIYLVKNRDTVSSKGASAKPDAAKTVKVAAILGLTGEGASYGQGAQKAIELAVNKIRQEKNIDMQVVWEDSQIDPQKAASSFQKLAGLEGIKYFTTMSSGEMMSMCPLAESGHDILLGTGSAPSITNCGDYTFRDIASDSYQGKEIADQLYARGLRKIAVMYINNDLGVGVKDEVEKNFKGQITDSEAHNQGEVDFRTQLLKVKNSNPDAIVLISYLAEGSNLLNQKAELGINAPVYTSQDLKDDNLIKKVPAQALENVYSFYPAQYNGKENQKYKDAFKQKYGEDYSAFSDYMYDATLMLGDAMSKCDNPNNVECVKDNLYKTNITGATGKITLDFNGDRTSANFDLYKIQNGQFVLVN